MDVDNKFLYFENIDGYASSNFQFTKLNDNDDGLVVDTEKRVSTVTVEFWFRFDSVLMENEDGQQRNL